MFLVSYTLSNSNTQEHSLIREMLKKELDACFYTYHETLFTAPFDDTVMDSMVVLLVRNLINSYTTESSVLVVKISDMPITSEILAKRAEKDPNLLKLYYIATKNLLKELKKD